MEDWTKFTAEKARDLRKNKPNHELINILRVIYSQAQSDFSEEELKRYYSLTEATKLSLEELGYSVREYNENDVTIVTTISWRAQP